SFGGRALGAIGDLGTLSFHETKNVSCGEGGALLVNDERLVARAEILQEKGTDRTRFARGEVDHYEWMDVGSSYLLSDVSAALLVDQLERVEEITTARMAVWDAYHAAFEPLERAGLVRRPVVPAQAVRNAHLYRLVFDDIGTRRRVTAALAAEGVAAYFHYVPLHSAPAGRRHGRVSGTMEVTDAAAAGLLRLPLWVGMSLDDVALVAGIVSAALGA
ncbi:MAG: DegT/DnrJ/EryC1/StrS family aminotransferase, partial [Actinobacteria bacterium]|nr:DegT/DnrJ/EryC1/StrS family aminotransferase [Actinomycetota bacterium]